MGNWKVFKKCPHPKNNSPKPKNCTTEALLKEKKEQVSNIPKDAVLRVAKNKDGAYGYIDENGTLVIEPKYDMAYPFKNGKALVSLLGKWMLIDMQGVVLQKIRL